LRPSELLLLLGSPEPLLLGAPLPVDAGDLEESTLGGGSANYR